MIMEEIIQFSQHVGTVPPQLESLKDLSLKVYYIVS